MVDRVALSDEISERQQWLLDMWRLQRQERELLGAGAVGVLSSESKKPIKILQNKVRCQKIKSIQDALSGEKTPAAAEAWLRIFEMRKNAFMGKEGANRESVGTTMGNEGIYDRTRKNLQVQTEAKAVGKGEEQ